MDQFSKKELAAILLKVPESGTIWLDEMIRKSLCDKKVCDTQKLQGFINQYNCDELGNQYVTEFPEIPEGYTENPVNDGVSPVPEGTEVDLIFLDGTELKNEVCSDVEWFRDDLEYVSDAGSCIYAYKISKP